MTLDELRWYFPHTHRTLYLNHAATGPLSRKVMTAIHAYLEQRHLTHIENYLSFLEPETARVTGQVARLLGTDASRVTFAPNTSSALNVLTQGLDWRRGDRVAIPACEFPANVYPFLNLRQRGVEVDFIPHREGAYTLDDIERVLTPRTRLLTLSWVQFLSGFRTDLAAVGRLCRAHDVLFCVDAIQGLGALQMDVEGWGIDFLATGGHKWLMATQGIGLLYVTERLQARLAPAAGWLHGPVDWEDLFDYRLAFHPGAERYRLGTGNSLGIVALGAALDLYFEAGPAWCEAQVLDRAGRLADGLPGLGLPVYGAAEAPPGAGIVTVRPPDPEGLFAHLGAQGIEASLRNRLLRFAPTYYNTPDEMEQVLEAVAAFGRTPLTR